MDVLSSFEIMFSFSFLILNWLIALKFIILHQGT